MRNGSELALVAAGVGFISLFSVPAVSVLAGRLQRRQERRPPIYQDADGKATPDSEKAFSTKYQKAFLLLSVVVGCGIFIPRVLLSDKAEGLSVSTLLSAAAWVSKHTLQLDSFAVEI